MNTLVSRSTTLILTVLACLAIDCAVDGPRVLVRLPSGARSWCVVDSDWLTGELTYGSCIPDGRSGTTDQGPVPGTLRRP